MWLDLAAEALIWWPYYAGFHASRWQATPGKRAFGIKVTGLGGERIGFARATARYFATILSALPLGVGFLMAAWTRKRQALHDMVAGTLVVNADLVTGALPEDRRVMELPGKVVAAVVGLCIASIAISYSGALHGTDEALVRAEGTPAGPASSPPREISYALYERPIFQQEWRVVREGRRTYTLADVRVTPGPASERDSSVKTLEIVDGFAIKAHIYREPGISGFGLSLDKDDGFSWDWYEHEQDDIFRKLQGGGRIKVRLASMGDGRVEVAEIRFLEDSTLRLDRRFMIPFTGRESDRLVVKAGSVLALGN